MTRYNKDIGKIGEEIATDYLIKNGHHIIHNNYFTHWGEIDIVTKKQNKFSFIEVKTRVGDSMGKPHESFTSLKAKNLKRAIQFYLLKNPAKEYKLSVDIVSIVLFEDMSVKSIKHFESISLF